MSVLRKYLIEGDASDKTDIKVALGKIKEKVKKIIAAIRDGFITTAAKAVVENTVLYGAPFTSELQTQMLVFDNKAFLESWREELSKQSAIYAELHPTTPPKPKDNKNEKPPSER
jgi:hypothetical protein